jgi:surface antigen
MKAFIASLSLAAALSFGVGGSTPAHAGACGPGMGTDQTVGTLAGAAAGGVIGNQFGHGSGKDAATIAGVVAGGLVGNQAGEAMDAQNCAPPAQSAAAPPPAPVYAAPAPTVVYQQAPPAVVYQPAPPPAVVYQPAPTYIIADQVTWGAPVWMGPGRQCRSYSQWAMVNGAMQPVYGVACFEGTGWRYVQPYRGAWHVDVVFDRNIHHGYPHDRGEHRGWDHDDHGHGHHH